jgi:hypothetical protein
MTRRNSKYGLSLITGLVLFITVATLGIVLMFNTDDKLLIGCLICALLIELALDVIPYLRDLKTLSADGTYKRRSTDNRN